MTAAIANLILNIMLVGLLAATIGYCWLLNRRIKILQDSKSELAGLLSQFDESTEKAAETIIAMQTASKKIGDNIQMRIDKANHLLDDLAYNIEKGTRLSSQIEASFAVNRAKTKVEHDEEADDMANFTPQIVEEKPAPRAPANGKRNAATIETILEKVVNRNKAPQHEEEVRQAASPVKGRSKAEQELLDLIRVGFKG